MTGAIPGSREPDPSSTGSGPSGFDPERVLCVDHATYDKMQKAAFAAEVAGQDQSVAAWKATGLPLPPIGSRFRISVSPEYSVPAIAMEARKGGDGETRLHPKDDSAGAKHIAQPDARTPGDHP